MLCGFCGGARRGEELVLQQNYSTEILRNKHESNKVNNKEEYMLVAIDARTFERELRGIVPLNNDK